MREPAVLLGLAIGDSLGVAFETLPWTSSKFDTWNGEYLPSEYHGCAPGEATDDAGMAAALAQSLIDQRGFVAERVAESYLAWFKTGPKGTGGTIREAMRRLDSGKSWSQSGVEGSTGTGTVMRCAPLGVWYRKNPVIARAFARVDASITHRSVDACDASEFLVTMISKILQYEDGMIACGEALELIPEGNLRFQMENLSGLVLQAYSETGSWYLNDNPNSQKVLYEKGRRILGPVLHSGGAVETTVIAVGAFLLTNNFKDCLDLAIRAGGDTDTQAAIAGAMAGALYGVDGIPTYLIEGQFPRQGLFNWGHYDALDRELWDGSK